LLVVAEIVDGRRRRPPRGRQRTIPRRRRRRAPSPRRQIVAPWGVTEPPAPVVVLGIPWRSPIVAAGAVVIAGSAVEVAGRWTVGAAAGSAVEVAGATAGSAVVAGAAAGSAVVAGWTTGEPARRTALAAIGTTIEITGWRTAGPTLTAWRTARCTVTRRTARATTARATTATWATLDPWGALGCGVGDARPRCNAPCAKHAADDCSGYQLIEFHYQAFPRRWTPQPRREVRKAR
jgi:hypothetical protein